MLWVPGSIPCALAPMAARLGNRYEVPKRDRYEQRKQDFSQVTAYLSSPRLRVSDSSGSGALRTCLRLLRKLGQRVSAERTSEIPQHGRRYGLLMKSILEQSQFQHGLTSQRQRLEEAESGLGGSEGVGRSASFRIQDMSVRLGIMRDSSWRQSTRRARTDQAIFGIPRRSVRRWGRKLLPAGGAGRNLTTCTKKGGCHERRSFPPADTATPDWSRVPGTMTWCLVPGGPKARQIVNRYDATKGERHEDQGRP